MYPRQTSPDIGIRPSPLKRMGRWWLAASVILALLLLAIVATTFIISRQARLDRAEAVLRAEIRRDIIDLQAKLVKVAADDRAGALTNDPRWYREREQTYAALLALSADLNARIVDPLQDRRISDFRRRAERYHRNILAAPEADAAGFVAARQQLVDMASDLQTLLDDLRARQEVLVIEHAGRAASDARLLERILWGAGLTGLALLVLLMAMLRRESRRALTLAGNLAAAASLQRAMLDSAGYMVIATDPGGTITLFNQAASTGLGYSAEEVVGSTTPATFHVPEEVEDRAEALSIELKRPVPVGFKTFVARADKGLHDQRQWTYVRKDGSRFPVELSVDAIRDEHGDVLGYVGMAVDLSERAERERSERALRMENERMAALHARISRTAPDVICTVDGEGRFTWLSEASTTVWGYAPEQLVGRLFMDLVHPADRERTAAVASELLQGRDRLNFENRYIAADGREVDVAWSSSLDPEAGHIVAVARDITRDKRMRAELVRSETMTRTILQTTLDAFVSMDAQGNVIEWNLQAQTLFGWPREEALGRLLADLIVPPAARTAHANGLAHYLATGEGPILDRRIEITALHREGHEFPIELTVWAMHDGDRPIFNAFLRDITERRQSEAKIIQLNAELTVHASELEQRNASLDSANKELESFSYSVSHDLRAPLRHLTGYAQMLAEDAIDRLQPDEQRYLQQIQSSGDRMGTLIDALLAFSRLGRTTLRKQPIDMSALVKRMLNELDRTPNPDARFTVGTLDDAPGDVALLGQVWANLLSNALKYSAPRGKQARIEVSSQRQSGRVVYQVRDNGVGFDMQYADKLFGVFQRLHNQDAFEGTGVGLAIIDRIVRRHGGEPTATAQVYQGAQIGFWLPLEQDT